MFEQIIDPSQKKKFSTAFLAAFVLLAVFLGVKTLSSIKQFTQIGRDTIAANVISVSGTGEVFAAPDTGRISFSVVETAKTVGDAQEKASKKINSAIDALKALGIEEKDIKTTGYNSYPQYDYTRTVCSPAPYSGQVNYVAPSCPPSKQVLVGYEVNQSITVKIRKTADAGAVLTKIGSLGVSNISGLDFMVDDIEAVQAEARDKAIQDAKAKAKVLAKSLGVRLVRIVGFLDDSGGGQIYYGGVMESKAMDMPAPTIPQTPVGEDRMVSNITITYEIQ